MLPERDWSAAHSRQGSDGPFGAVSDQMRPSNWQLSGCLGCDQPLKILSHTLAGKTPANSSLLISPGSWSGMMQDVYHCMLSWRCSGDKGG